MPPTHGRAAHARGYYPYLLPLLLGVTLVALVPFLANVVLSFTRWSGAGRITFVGWTNYQRLVVDELFWQSFLHSLVFIVAMAVVPTAVGLLISAVLVDYVAPRFGPHISSGLRAALYLPQILPIVVAGVLWGWLLQPNNGAVNTVLRALGLGFLTMNWLGQPAPALASLTVILIWLQLGYTIVVFMAGMARVDPSLHEAAQLDGASWWQRFRVVTIPQLRPEIAVVLLTATVTALKVFAPVYAVTKGGPGTATIVPSYFSYFAFFTQSRVGYGAAIATVLALLIGVIAILMLRFQLRRETD